MKNLLQDVWLNLQSYYEEIVALLPKLVLAIIVLILFSILANRIKKVLKRSLTERMDDPLLAVFLSRIAKAVILIVGFLLMLKILGLASIAAGIITGASVSAIVVGFAFKDIGENFLAGIMLAFNRPFRVGDIVDLDGYTGTVQALNLRNSQIKTFDGKDIFIPNASIVKNSVVNYTMDGFLRQDFTVRLDYGADITKASRVILDTLAEVPGILQESKNSSVFINDLDNSSIQLTAHYWINTFNKSFSSLAIKTEAIHQTLTALDQAGFYLPRDVIEMKNFRGEDFKTNFPNKSIV